MPKLAMASFCRQKSDLELQCLLQDIADQPLFEDRRSGKRIAMRLTLSIQPLDREFHPVGNSFHAITRDFSEGGIGFLHPERFPATLLKISSSDLDDCKTSVARVRYHYPTSEGFLIGVQFAAMDESGNYFFVDAD